MPVNFQEPFMWTFAIGLYAIAANSVYFTYAFRWADEKGFPYLLLSLHTNEIAYGLMMMLQLALVISAFITSGLAGGKPADGEADQEFYWRYVFMCAMGLLTWMSLFATTLRKYWGENNKKNYVKLIDIGAFFAGCASILTLYGITFVRNSFQNCMTCMTPYNILELCSVIAVGMVLFVEIVVAARHASANTARRYGLVDNKPVDCHLYGGMVGGHVTKFRLPKEVMLTYCILSVCFALEFFNDYGRVFTWVSIVVFYPLLAAGWCGDWDAWYEHFILAHHVIATVYYFFDATHVGIPYPNPENCYDVQWKYFKFQVPATLCGGMVNTQRHLRYLQDWGNTDALGYESGTMESATRYVFAVAAIVSALVSFVPLVFRIFGYTPAVTQVKNAIQRTGKKVQMVVNVRRSVVKPGA